MRDSTDEGAFHPASESGHPDGQYEYSPAAERDNPLSLLATSTTIGGRSDLSVPFTAR
jgi:hypothetical protein